MSASKSESDKPQQEPPHLWPCEPVPQLADAFSGLNCYNDVVAMCGYERMATNDLKIRHMNRSFGQPEGGDAVSIKVEKVINNHIIVRFFELNEYGDEVWAANADFLPSDVHPQYAIVVRSPPYRDPEITKDVKVYIQLIRMLDGRTSEAKEFVYKGKRIMSCKHRRLNSYVPVVSLID